RDSCCVISTGCTISICNMTHPPSIQIHLSRSPTEVTPSFHFGCRARAVTLVQKVTSSCLTPSLRILPCFWYWGKLLLRSGCESLIGLQSMEAWPLSTYTLITCPSTAQGKQQQAILWRYTKNSSGMLNPDIPASTGTLSPSK